MSFNMPNPHARKGAMSHDEMANLCVFDTYAESQAVQRYLKYIWPDGDYPPWIPVPVSREGGPAWRSAPLDPSHAP